MKRIIIFLVLLIAGIVVALPMLFVDLREEKLRSDTDTIRVYLADEDRTVEMTMTDYLIGALAAEIPAAFDDEALRAQAVAARTYATLQMKRYGGAGYRDADISTDYRVHQAYIGEMRQRDKWKADYEKYHAKLMRAVQTTAGEVMTYDGKLIRALYHSMCGGHTASSQEVWDTPLPYLVGVECNWDHTAPRYREEKHLTFAELSGLLGQDAITMTASADRSEPIRIVNRTESGRADLVRLGGQNYAGTDLRAKLGLRSANFSAQATDSGITFTTVGYGHGVGMCQYGAGGMARAGYGYRDILAHYYQGIKIENIQSLHPQ